MEQKLTQQEIFDQVANHLLTQMKRSRDIKNKQCLYRGPNGTSCAVGGIITDQELGQQDNSLSVGSLVLPSRLKDEKTFLRSLQVIHDANKPSKWIGKLANFAKLSKLNADVLKRYRKPKTPKVEKVLTEQQIFDKVVSHLLTQKKKSLMPKPMRDWCKCAYRGVGGLSCAVGCLITDHEASNIGEDQPVDNVILMAPRLSGHEDFLKALQLIHDESKPSRWYEKLSALANKKKFDRTVLNTFRK